MAQIFQPRIEIIMGGNGPHIARGSLGDNGSDLPLMLGERPFDSLDIVIGHDNSVGSGRTSNTRRIRQRKSSNPRTGGGKKRIYMAVIAALKLQDLRATGKPTGQTNRRHGGLSTGIDHADFRHTSTVNNHLRKINLGLGWGAKRQTVHHGLSHSSKNFRVSIPQKHRPPGIHKINVLVAINVVKLRTVCLSNKPSLPPN